LQQEHFEIRITGNLGDVNVIDIKIEESSHGCNEAGFACPGRAIKKITSFPYMA
jgi:hypothetical protein